MKNPDNSVYLRHILDSIDIVEQYIRRVDAAAFYGDVLIQDAFVRRIQIIGEAVRRITPEFRQKHPEVSWQEIADMRSKLVHDYIGVDLAEVWSSATIDLPALRGQIQSIIESLP